MAVFFSDLFGGDGIDDTSIASPRVSAAPGKKHSRMRISYGMVDDNADAMAAADTVRFATIKSGDRISQVRFSTDGAFTGGTLDLGLALAGTAHDGAVVDADLFASALDVTSAINGVDEFAESAVLAETDRGKRVWELAAIGAGSYTADPLVDFDILGTLGGTPAGPGIMLVELIYSSE